MATPVGTPRENVRASSMGRTRTSLMGRVSRISSSHIRSQFKEEEFLVHPKDNVYSYFLFSILESRFLDKIVAYFLVIISLLMQSVLLYAIFNKVVLRQLRWQQGILVDPAVDTHSWNLIAAYDPDKCVDGSSLCTQDGGIMTCAPPTIQLTGRWDELDLDGDGIWTFQEAKRANDKIKCRYGVDATETFHVIIQFVLNRQNLVWIHPDLAAGEAIHKAYFTFAVGDIIMCGYRDSHMCTNLLEKGFFDAPLKHNTVPRIGNTTESALNYCHDLLAPFGTCERVLPSAYAVWKVETVEECGAADYSKFTFLHPETGSKKSLLTVDYEARQDYEQAQTLFFVTYKLIIMFVWILAMVNEGKEVLGVISWIVHFPALKDSEKEVDRTGGDDDDSADSDVERQEMTPRGTNLRDIEIIVIEGVHAFHRSAVAVVSVFRTMMLIMLTVVGITLLLRSNSYLDLLFDAVSLAFVLEIANILYSHVLRQEKRDEIESIEPMKVHHIGIVFFSNSPAAPDILYFLLAVGIAMGVLYLNNIKTIVPMQKALDCACLQHGATCFESTTFNYDFWYDYWKVETPAVFELVDGLHSEYDLSIGPTTTATPILPTVVSGAGVAVNQTPADKDDTTDAQGGNTSLLLYPRATAHASSKPAAAHSVAMVGARPPPHKRTHHRARHMQRRKTSADTETSLHR